MACYLLIHTISKCHLKLLQLILLFIKISSILIYFKSIKILLISLYFLKINKIIDFIFWFKKQFTILGKNFNQNFNKNSMKQSLLKLKKCSNINFYGLKNNQKNLNFMYLNSFISFLYLFNIKNLLKFIKCPLYYIIIWIKIINQNKKNFKCLKEKGVKRNCVKTFFILFIINLNNIPVNCNSKVSVPGDILLGGLFPVHQKGSKPEISSFNSTNQTTLCGPINKDRGIQRVEAMLFALDKINQNEKILPTIKLGAIILDTCASDTYALNQSLEFIRASVNTVESSAFECADNSTPKFRYKTKIITGVVGGSYSEVSLQVANLLRLFRIPQVSYASTTTSLSDKTRYDFFARTVPPDKYQARTLVDLVAYFNWSYVSIVSSEGQYGDSGLIAFIRSARNRNICIAANEKVTHSANTSSFDQIFESLLAKPNAKGVVLFLRMEDARGLLLAAKRANRMGMFTWIAADGWGKELKLVENVEEIALGAITVELQSETVFEFDQYFKKLRLFPPVVSKNNIDKSDLKDYIINNRNPWFRDYWQEVFECQLPKETKLSQTLTNYDDLMLSDQPSSSNNEIFNENFYEFSLLTAYKQGDYELFKKLNFSENFHDFNKSVKSHFIYKKPNFINDKKYLKQLYLNKQFSKKYVKNRSKRFTFQKDQRPLCSSHLSLRDVHHKQEPKIQFVVDAVFAFAHALHNAWSIKCNATGKICQALRDLDGGEFYNNYLLNVSFLDPVGSLVRFDANGDGLGRYNVYNFQRSNTSETNFTYKRIGSWSDNGLKLNVKDIYWNVRRLPHNLIPTSRCSEPCGVGEIKITQSTSETCCWICQQCKSYEYVSSKGKCEDCGVGFWPLINKTACYELPITYIKWTSYYALVPIVLAILGIFLTLFVIITFLKHMDTPIVKASGRELSFILLFGLVWCFSMTFFLLAPPTVYICALQRFGIGFGFSIVYGSLLTKTNRISRIFNSARNSARRPSFISPRSQVILTLALVSIQVIETVIWFILEEPGVKKDVTEEKRWLVTLKCRAKDTSTLFSLAYNMLLITTCTAYAFKTRKIPENFNESKFIGFTMYTTCIIWLAFVPIFFGTGNSHEIQITTLCTSISLSAYVTLFCLFSPKIYIIIFHPDKNVRKLTMNSNTHKKSAISSGIYFPTNQDSGTNSNSTRHQITIEQYSSQSSTNDSFIRNQNLSNKRLQTNFNTPSNEIKNDQNIKNDDKKCIDKKVKENDINLFNPSNQLSVMMFVPGFNPVPINRLDPHSNNTIQGYELRKRSNSFTQGQTVNFISKLEVNNEHINHHHRILYQAPFFFNNEVAQQTLNCYKNENDIIINQSKQSNENKLLNSNEFNETTISKVNTSINQLNEDQVTVELLSQRSFIIENDEKDEESQI